MGDLPLHPGIVHVPLGLSLVMPLIAAAVAWMAWRGKLPWRGWALVVLLQAVVVGSAAASMRTGEAEEETVEQVVSGSLIHEHEERAEQFTWLAAATLALAAATAFVGEQRKLYGAVATTVAAALVTGLGLRAGHAGGELVYRYGAAGAYGSAAVSAPALEGASGHEDD